MVQSLEKLEKQIKHFKKFSSFLRLIIKKEIKTGKNALTNSNFLNKTVAQYNL